MADAAGDQAARERALYDYGSTTVFASKADPRFCYCLYVPKTLKDPGRPPELVVVMHGTGRTFIQYRDAFAAFGRWHNCVILAPLFPVGPLGDGNSNGFKYMAEGELRYDRVLLAMVGEVEERYGVRFPQFALWGYSGGGHFAHRFLFLQPERLWAVSVGAPGSVTLPNDPRPWWVGTGDMAARFGRPFDAAAVARVPAHLVVGAADLETWEITHREGGRYHMPGANDAGRTRPERLDTLRRELEAIGARVRHDVLPNVPHDGIKVVDTVQSFLSDTLAARRGGAPKQELVA